MATEMPSEPRRTYHLPSGEASTTLRQFAGLLGRQVLFLSDKVRGEHTNAISGQYTAREALNLMLADTNLVALEDAVAGGFVVSRRSSMTPQEVGRSDRNQPQPKSAPMNPSKPAGKLRTLLAHLALATATAATAQQSRELSSEAKKDEVVVLSPFTVSATTDVGYGSLMNTSGRLAKEYVDVPQMANVVTSELLRDMKRFDSYSALTFVPGVTTAVNLFQTVKMRGLESSSRFIDGFKGPAFGNGAVSDLAFTDRVEVVKGPAPGSFGRGDPAGYINYVTKDPTFRRSTDIEVMVGTGNDDTISQRYMIDTNGLLTEDGKTAYRLVAVSSKGAETPSHSEYEDNGLMLAAKRSFAGRGTLTVKALASTDKIPGTVTPLNAVDQDFHNGWNNFTRDLGVQVVDFPILDRNTWLAYDSTHSSTRTFSTTAVLDYKLSEHWSTRQAAKLLQTKSNNDFLFNGSYQYAADGITALSTPVRVLQQNAYRTAAYQADFVGQYKIPSIGGSLEILAGGDYSAATQKTASDAKSAFNPQPLTSWNPHLPLPGWSLNPDVSYSREFRKDWSVYTQLEARYWNDRLRFTGAWRRNYTDLKSKNTISGVRTAAKTTSPLLPAYSVLAKLNEALSVYALYSQYIEPPTTRAVWSGLPSSDPRSQERTSFQPQTKLAEIGIKGNLLDGRFSFSVCAYDLKQGGFPGFAAVSDSAASDGNGIINHLFPSDAGAKGFEFECFGKITPKLTFTLNGAYVYSSHVLSVFNPVGKPSIVTNNELASNSNTLSGYATYSFTGSRRRGLTLTVGTKTIFSGWQMAASYLRASPYPHTNTLVDLGASYGFNDRWEVYFKGNNVFKDAFIPTNEAGVVFGRKLLAGITARF